MDFTGMSFEEVDVELDKLLGAGREALDTVGCLCPDRAGASLLPQLPALDGKCAICHATDAINALDGVRRGRAAASTRFAHIFQDRVVAMQCAWIEWQHGAGAEAAMQWVDNFLNGPDEIPSPDDESAYDAQEWWLENRSELWKMPECECGRRSTIQVGGTPPHYYCDDACRKSQEAGNGPVFTMKEIAPTMGGVVLPRGLLRITAACREPEAHCSAREDQLCHVHVTDAFVEATDGRILVRRPLPASDPGRDAVTVPTLHMLVPRELLEHAIQHFPGTETEVEVYGTGGVAGALGREARVQCPSRPKAAFPDVDGLLATLGDRKPAAVVSLNPWLLVRAAAALGADVNHPGVEVEVYAGPIQPVRLRRWAGPDSELEPGFALLMPMERTKSGRRRVRKARKVKA